MALQCAYQIDDVIVGDAYLRIVKVKSSQVDYENFVNVDDPDNPNIAQRLEWTVRIESTATVFVWTDKAARDNRVPAVKWFDFDFDYDLHSNRNIYEQAYIAMKGLELFKDAIDV